MCAQKLATWRGPTTFILGTPPEDRKCHGQASALQRIFIFGGTSSSGGTVSSPTSSRSTQSVVRKRHTPPNSRLWDFAINQSTDTPNPITPPLPPQPPGSRRPARLLTPPAPTFPAILGDLHQFDPARLAWTDLSDAAWNPASAPPPPARCPFFQPPTHAHGPAQPPALPTVCIGRVERQRTVRCCAGSFTQPISSATKPSSSPRLPSHRRRHARILRRCAPNGTPTP